MTIPNRTLYGATHYGMQPPNHILIRHGAAELHGNTWRLAEVEAPLTFEQSCHPRAICIQHGAMIHIDIAGYSACAAELAGGSDS